MSGAATTVVNMRGGNSAYDIRIDRKGPYGNPFVIGVDGDRDEVVAKFSTWVHTSPCARSLWVRQHVHELRGKRLGCWCYPLNCHGHVLAALADADFININIDSHCFTCGRAIGRGGLSPDEFLRAIDAGEVVTSFGATDYKAPQPWPTTYYCHQCFEEVVSVVPAPPTPR